MQPHSSARPQATKKKTFGHDDGIAVVEAAFVFPLMFLLLFALVLLALYLPQRAALQRAVQYAANTVTTELSDTWVYYSAKEATYRRYGEYITVKERKGHWENSLFNQAIAGVHVGDRIATLYWREWLSYVDSNDLGVKGDPFSYRYELINEGVFKKVILSAKRDFYVPVDLSFIGFPNPFPLVVSATVDAVNGDEFIRQIDFWMVTMGWLQSQYPDADILGDILDGSGIFDDINDFVNDALDDAEEFVAGATDAIDSLTDAVDSLTDAIDDITGLVNDVKNAIDDAINDITNAIDDIISDVTDAIDEIINNVSGAIDDIINDVTSAVDDIINDVTSAVDDAMSALDDAKDAIDSAKDAIDEAKNALDDARYALDDALNALNDALNALKDAPDGEKDALKDAVSDALNDVKDAMHDVKDALDDAKDAVSGG